MTQLFDTPTMVTDRLSLEPLSLDHLPALFEISQDRDSIEDFQKASSDYEYFMGWIHEAMSENECAWAIIVDGDVLGMVSFEQIQSSESEIGFFLAKGHQGRGIATTAIRAALANIVRLFPHIKAITAHVTASNFASNRVLQKCGFQYIRTMKGNWEWRGVLHDSNELIWVPQT